MSDLDELAPYAPSRPTGRIGMARGGGAATGPYDSEDPVADKTEATAGRVDFGSLHIAIPERAQLQVEKGGKELLRAVHVLVPSGRVSLSALAAPRSNGLWRDLAREIGESLAGDGADVCTEWGEWGREVAAGSKGALSRFIGVDGPRWMLYGVATGPQDGADELADVLREMIRTTVVHRGTEPLPVKTVLPLRLPEHLEDSVEQAREVSARKPKKSTKRPGARKPGRTGPARDTEAGPGTAPAREAPAPGRAPMAPRRPMGQPGGPPTAPGTGPAAAMPPPVPSFEPPRPPSRPMAVPPPAPGLHPAEAVPLPPMPEPMPAAGAQPALVQLPPLPSAPRSIGSPGSGGWPAPAGPGPAGPGSRRGSIGPIGLPPISAGPARTSSPVEATWRSSQPVVSADEVSHQPAWALLSEAPSFWPDERFRPDPAAAPSPPDTRQPDSRTPDSRTPDSRTPDSHMPDSPIPEPWASAARPPDRWATGPGPSGSRPPGSRSPGPWAAQARPASPPEPWSPGAWSPRAGAATGSGAWSPGGPTGSDAWSPGAGAATGSSDAWVSGAGGSSGSDARSSGAGGPSGSWSPDPIAPTGPGRDEPPADRSADAPDAVLTGTDALHAVLTGDAAATRDWAARAARRGRHRRATD